MSGCQQCGRQTPNRLCRDCKRDARHEDAFVVTFDEELDVLTNGGYHTSPAVHQLAGVADQEPTYPNGSLECARPDDPPCFECVLEADDKDSDDQELIADGGTSGVINYDFEDNERSTRELLEAAVADIQTEPMAGGVAIDLVTRQPLFVRRVVAESIIEYYEDEEFDLLSYKTHPYLPVRLADTVYQCVYISGDPERAQKTRKTYDFPRDRLMHIPVEQAWTGGDGE